jgi:hypothetical protein
VVESTLPSGTAIREYTGADGIVFAVAWQGPAMPDLQELFGANFAPYIDDVKASRTTRPAHSGPITIRRTGLVVESGGHMRAYLGRAWLPALLPSGISLNAIR